MTVAATVGAALSETARRLALAGVDQPRLEARLLVGRALEADAATVLGDPERPLGGSQRERLASLVARRAGREPLARIVGVREFWSLPFVVTADTLIPRPESETLVEAALSRVGDRSAPVSILDLGTGTGCLLLSLLHELAGGRGLGVDISAAALGVAQRNADALGLTGRASFVLGDWGEALSGRFDLVVANPPYVADGEIETLAPEVARFEPRGALAGGRDGLDAFRRLIPQLARLTCARGAAFVEVGLGQASAVAALATDFRRIEVEKDLAGVARCLVLRHPWR